MPRPAADVRRVIKAYDVRGLVGTEIDEAFVRDVGAAFARLMRTEGAPGSSRVVIGHDMRDSSPVLSTAFAEGVTAQGLDVVRVGGEGHGRPGGRRSREALASSPSCAGGSTGTPAQPGRPSIVRA